MILLLAFGVARAEPARAWAEGPAAVTATELSPGLAVAEVRPGTGEALRTGDVAVVSYVGWLDDGTVWDSTLDRSVTGLPAGTARLRIGDRRVPGVWSEGLLGLRVGGVRQLVLRDPDAAREGPARTLTVAFELIEVEVPPTRVPPVARAVGADGGLDLRVGDGAVADEGARVVLDYTLWLADGAEVDSSWRWPEPFSFRIGGTPAVRWSDAILGMRAGGRRQVTIPAAEAFGGEGRPPLIPPGADLVLTVDLRQVAR